MAVLFDAETDAYTASSGVHSGSAFTITWWCKLHASNAGNSSIWTINQAGPPWVRMMTSDVNLQVFDGNLYGGAGFGVITLTLDTWYKCAVVANGATATFYRAAAGSPLAAVQVVDFEAVSTPTQMALGQDVDANGNWWNGSIACFKYWQAALTATEVDVELSSWDAVRTANLVRYHRLRVPETTDYSGNANSLTAGSTAATVDADADPGIVGVGVVTYVATATPTPVGTTTTASTVAITPALPTGTAIGDRVFVIQAGNNTNGGTPAGWTSLATDTQVGPTGTAPGAGTGRRYLSVFYRDYDGAWSMPSFTLTSAAQNTNAAAAITLRKGPYDIWNTPTVSTAGSTASAVTSYSVTTGALTTVGGMVLVGSATNDNVTASAETLSQTGATFANLTERSDTGSATGNDVAIRAYTASVTTGGVTALTHTATLSAASEGGSVVVAQTAVSGAPSRTITANAAALVRASSW